MWHHSQRWIFVSCTLCSPSPNTVRSRRPPGPAHRAVQRFNPYRPARNRTRLHPDRPGPRRTHLRGEIVADRARRIIGELRSIEHDLASLSDEVSGHVRLGIIGTTARWLVAPLLDALQGAYPLIEMVIIEATTTSLLPQLVSERLDAAVVNLPVDHPDVDTRPLFDEDRIVVVPAAIRSPPSTNSPWPNSNPTRC